MIDLNISNLVSVDYQIAAIREWLIGWGNRYPPLLNPLLLTGVTGTGKTTIAKLVCEANGFHPQFLEEEKIDELFQHAMLPTLEGETRISIIDNAESISKKSWGKITKKISDKLFPVIIIIEDEKSVSWSVRKLAKVVGLNRPNQKQLEIFLTKKNSDLKLNKTKNDIINIAKHSRTWRSAGLKLLTTPSCWNQQWENPESSTYKKSNHPLSEIEYAEYNNADVSEVETANYLQSKSWKVAGLTKIFLKSKQFQMIKFHLEKGDDI